VLLTVGRAEMESWDEASIAVLQRSTGDLRIVLEGGSQAAYSSTGHLVYLRGSSLLAVPFDLSDLRVRGTPVPVIEGVNWEAGFGLSEDGTLVYAPGAATRPRSRMLLADRGGTELRQLAEGAEYHNPRFSPDGGRVAFTSGAFMSGVTADIRVLDLARGTETAITSGWINGWPSWAPDGRYVQFQSMRSGEWNSHRRLADGSGDVEHLLATPDHLSRRVGEAAGVALWVETPGPDISSGSDLMLRSPETGAPLRPFLATPAFEAWAELSPDRQWVAYNSDQSGRFEVYLRPFPEGTAQWLVSTGGGRHPRWSRGGREIVFLDGDRVMAVDVRVAEGTPELGRPRLLFERPIAWKWGNPAYDVAPDGQSFVIAEPGEATPTADHLVLVQNFGEELKRRVAGAVSR
jgi:serine/threonine-protein kinase